MARKLKPDDGDSTQLEHNSAARAEYQNAKFQEWFDLDARVRAAELEHVKPLKDLRTKLTRQMKADLNIHGEDMKIAYALFKRGRLADDFEDANETAKVHDSLRELMNNLKSGGMVDFLSVIAAAENAASADEASIEAARQAGFDAGYAGEGPEKNPYQPGDLAETWDRAHLSGEKQAKIDGGKGKKASNGAAHDDAGFGEAA